MNTIVTEGEKRNPLLYLFSKTWQYSTGNHRKVRLYWALFIIGNAITLISQPLLLGNVFNTIQQEGVTRANFGHIVLFSVLGMLVSVVYWMFHGPARVIEEANAFNASTKFRSFLLRGVMALPLSWHADHHSGDTGDKIDKGHDGQYSFASQSFQIISAGVQLIVSYSMLAYYSWPSAIVVMLLLVVSMAITIAFDKRIIVNYKLLNRAENEVVKSIADALSNITTIITLRVERLICQTIQHKMDEPYVLANKTSILTEMKWALVSASCHSMTVIVLVIYLLQQMHTGAVVLSGSVFILIKYLGQVEELFFQFTSKYSSIIRDRARVANAEELATNFSETALADHVLPAHWNHIDIKNLCFTYPNAIGMFHLNDVALTIRRGERIALVGESGSGKSTFLQILRGLHAPSSLQLSVDGVPIAEGFAGIEQAITLVPQGTEVFATTVRHNITLGVEHDEATVKKFAHMGRFGERVERMPKGYDSVIGEKGVQLSIGERQRMAVSRGFLAARDKSILAMDEPTSNVDGINERHIYENIRAEFGDKTVIISIHGLHLQHHFDRIIMFDKGSIVADGTFEKLRASSEPFRLLLQNYMQAA